MRGRVKAAGVLGLGACALAAAVLLVGSCEEAERGSGPAGRLGHWSSLGPSGAEGKGLSGVQAVRLGRMAMIVAGVTYSTTKVAAVAFDVRTGRSVPVARSPLDWRALHSVVAADDQVVVWGGTSGMTNGIGEPGPGSEGARYAPADDVWSAVAPSPLQGRFAHTAIGTPKAMLVWGGVATGDGAASGFLDDGALYSPSADRWRRVADGPLSARRDASAVWTGERVLIWGGEIRLAGGRRGDFARDGASYDPERDSWERIAKAPIRSTPTTQAFWTGSRMLVWTGGEALAYDPRSDRWSRLPEPPIRPREGSVAAWSEGELYVWGGVRGVCGDCYLRANQVEGARDSDGVAYSPDERRWRVLPRSPLAPRDRHALVGVPGGFLTWGGCCAGSRQRSSGAVYRRGATGARPAQAARSSQPTSAASSSISEGPAATSP